MSASEKLKALGVYTDKGWDSGPYDNDERWRAEDLLDALPQIVAVVEAHQRLTDEVQRSLTVIPEPIPDNAGAGELRLFEFCVESKDALAALEEALGGAGV